MGRTATAMLADLLMETFSDTEALRRFLASEDATRPLVNELPGGSARFSHVTFEAADMLVRWRLADRGLFVRLSEVVPNLTGRINEVFHAVGDVGDDPAPDPTLRLITLDDLRASERALRSQVARLAPDADDLVEMAAGVGLDPAGLDLRGPAVVAWHNVFEAARDADRMEELAVEIGRRFPQTRHHVDSIVQARRPRQQVVNHGSVGQQINVAGDAVFNFGESLAKKG